MMKLVSITCFLASIFFSICTISVSPKSIRSLDIRDAFQGAGLSIQPRDIASGSWALFSRDADTNGEPEAILGPSGRSPASLPGIVSRGSGLETREVTGNGRVIKSRKKSLCDPDACSRSQHTIYMETKRYGKKECIGINFEVAFECIGCSCVDSESDPSNASQPKKRRRTKYTPPKESTAKDLAGSGPVHGEAKEQRSTKENAGRKNLGVESPSSEILRRSLEMRLSSKYKSKETAARKEELAKEMVDKATAEDPQQQSQRVFTRDADGIFHRAADPSLNATPDGSACSPVRRSALDKREEVPPCRIVRKRGNAGRPCNVQTCRANGRVSCQLHRSRPGATPTCRGIGFELVNACRGCSCHRDPTPQVREPKTKDAATQTWLVDPGTQESRVGTPDPSRPKTPETGQSRVSARLGNKRKLAQVLGAGGNADGKMDSKMDGKDAKKSNGPPVHGILVHSPFDGQRKGATPYVNGKVPVPPTTALGSPGKHVRWLDLETAVSA